jgi:predicted CXXCH cytochrome family protein
MITDDKCLNCHSKEAHGAGKVVLVDPKSDGKAAWGGDIKGFCLGCHEGRDSLKSDHGKRAKGKMCTDCHHPHGADRSLLLKNWED